MMEEKMTKMCDNQKFTKDNKEMNQYSYVDSDDNFMYCYNYATKKMNAIPYSVDDKDNINCDYSKAKMAKLHCSASDDGEDDDVYMNVKNTFSSDANVEAVAAAKMNDMQAEYEKKLADMGKEKDEMATELEESKKNMAKVKEENAKLKENEAKKAKDEMAAKVDYTINSLFDKVPKDKEDQFVALKEEGKNCSTDTFSAWENKLKAFAFDCGISNKNDNKEIRMQLPWNINNQPNSENSSSLWDLTNLNK